jgi:uncharacterized protein with PQ loop repeat
MADFISNISITEWVGYMASVVVLISFLMKNITKLRIINIVGCALFIAYGYLLNISLPIIITNASIVLINFYYLFKSKS